MPGWQISSISIAVIIAIAICFSLFMFFTHGTYYVKPISASAFQFQCVIRNVFFFLFAKVWVLWVPLEDEKVTTQYSDRAVAHESSIEEKNPTERKIQEYKEKRDQLWDWEDEQPAVTGSGAGGGSKLSAGCKRSVAAAGGEVPAVGNRKHAKQMKTGPPHAAQSNVTLEAAKYKAATIKD